MSIFFDTKITVEMLNDYCKNTMCDPLGIRFSKIGEDYLQATMLVSASTVQPLRMLNGGASLALCEITGSMAANMVLDRSKFVALGLDLNGNHIKGVKEGESVTATAKPLHTGNTTQVWEIRITNSQDQLVHISRLTMAVKTL